MADRLPPSSINACSVPDVPENWVPSNGVPDSIPPYHIFIEFRTDIIKLPNSHNFSLSGKVGDNIWSNFLKETKKMGRLNQNFDFIFDHEDNVCCLYLHIALTFCCAGKVVEAMETKPPVMFQKWHKVFKEYGIQAKLYYRPGDRHHAMMQRRHDLTQRFHGIMLTCNPDDMYLKSSALTSSIINSHEKQNQLMDVGETETLVVYSRDDVVPWDDEAEDTIVYTNNASVKNLELLQNTASI